MQGVHTTPLHRDNNLSLQFTQQQQAKSSRPKREIHTSDGCQFFKSDEPALCQRGTHHKKPPYEARILTSAGDKNFEHKKTVKQAKSYSPAKQIAVPSALEGLTSGFGMGPGGPPPLFSPASTALSKLVKRSYRSLYSPLQLVTTLPCPLRFRISSARDFEQNGS